MRTQSSLDMRFVPLCARATMLQGVPWFWNTVAQLAGRRAVWPPTAALEAADDAAVKAHFAKTAALLEATPGGRAAFTHGARGTGRQFKGMWPLPSTSVTWEDVATRPDLDVATGTAPPGMAHLFGPRAGSICDTGEILASVFDVTHTPSSQSMSTGAFSALLCDKATGGLVYDVLPVLSWSGDVASKAYEKIEPVGRLRKSNLRLSGEVAPLYDKGACVRVEAGAALEDDAQRVATNAIDVTDAALELVLGLGVGSNDSSAPTVADVKRELGSCFRVDARTMGGHLGLVIHLHSLCNVRYEAQRARAGRGCPRCTR